MFHGRGTEIVSHFDAVSRRGNCLPEDYRFRVIREEEWVPIAPPEACDLASENIEAVKSSSCTRMRLDRAVANAATVAVQTPR